MGLPSDSTNAALAAAGIQLPIRAGHDGEILDAAGECHIVVDPNRELADEKVAVIAAAVVVGLNAHAAHAGEASLLTSRLNDPDWVPDGTIESLRECANMLETYGPDCFPVSPQGQVDFARCMMDATASEIRAFLEKVAGAEEEVACDRDGPR